MKWLEIAHAEMGIEEVPGAGSNPRILEYAKAAGYTPTRGDGDPWCGNFCSFVMKAAGYEPPQAPWRAASWDGWGTPTTARKGAIARFPRGKNPKQGHVAIVDRVAGDWVYCIGGNQNDSVSIAKFAKARAVAYRWPPNAPAPVPGVVAAVKSSRTLTGVLLAAVGTVVQWLEGGVQVALDAAARVAEWAPAQGLLAGMGANARVIGVGMAVAGLLLAAYRRFSAAYYGTEG